MPICKKDKKSMAKKKILDYGPKANSIYSVIESEAWEKAAEIDVKTEEERNAIRRDFLKGQRDNIDGEFKNRSQKTVTETKKHNANVISTARHQETENKQSYINQICEEIARRIEKDMRDESRYSEILRKLITEGLYKLLEPRVAIVCRERDKQIIEGLLPDVQNEYTRKTSLPIALIVAQRRNLSGNSLGGVNMTVKNGRITLENTLESRLDKIVQHQLPAIKRSLFGKKEKPKDSDPNSETACSSA